MRCHSTGISVIPRNIIAPNIPTCEHQNTKISSRFLRVLSDTSARRAKSETLKMHFATASSPRLALTRSRNRRGFSDRIPEKALLFVADIFPRDTRLLLALQRLEQRSGRPLEACVINVLAIRGESRPRRLLIEDS